MIIVTLTSGVSRLLSIMNYECKNKCIYIYIYIYIYISKAKDEPRESNRLVESFSLVIVRGNV